MFKFLIRPANSNQTSKKPSGLCKTGLSSRNCLVVSFTAALVITALLIKNISWQHVLSENQTENCSLKIFIYSEGKKVCLSELLAVTEVLQGNIHLLPKETGQIVHVILDHTVLVLLLLLI